MSVQLSSPPGPGQEDDRQEFTAHRENIAAEKSIRGGRNLCCGENVGRSESQDKSCCNADTVLPGILVAALPPGKQYLLCCLCVPVCGGAVRDGS